MKKFIRLIFFLIILAIVLRAFIIDAFRIPTSSMADTLYPGDFIIVNLAAYKLNTPREIPILGLSIPSINIFDTGKPEINDLIVFKFPVINSDDAVYNNINLIKRIVALPGDTLQIINKKIFINRKEINLPETARHGFENIKPKGKEDEGIFYSGTGWNSDNYGPVRVPAMEDTIKFNTDIIEIWKRLIVYEYEKKVVRKEGSVITINDKPVRNYVIKKNHYFVIGDNFNNSHDSRYFGFVNEDMILGKAMFIYLSIDPAKSGSDFISKIRWKRIFRGM
ncbi:MAG: signal peptidase I [Bacteroidetes bacterium]|nr:signal peptidase I [Bacteroidota bacterium]